MANDAAKPNIFQRFIQFVKNTATDLSDGKFIKMEEINKWLENSGEIGDSIMKSKTLASLRETGAVYMDFDAFQQFLKEVAIEISIHYELIIKNIICNTTTCANDNKSKKGNEQNKNELFEQKSLRIDNKNELYDKKNKPTQLNNTEVNKQKIEQEVINTEKSEQKIVQEADTTEKIEQQLEQEADNNVLTKQKNEEEVINNEIIEQKTVEEVNNTEKPDQKNEEEVNNGPNNNAQAKK